MSMQALDKAKQFKTRFDALRAEIGRVIVGQNALVDGVLTAIFAGGHCLLEGVPGLGKTQLVRTLSGVFGLRYSRIQFTPDLMPADIVGTNIITEDEQGKRSYTYRRGPIFANLVLADEINRATPKTQSALLEAMQERSVTVWGTTHLLEPPMFVLATQNPIEMEGTYPLPEAQLDRFMAKLIVELPSRAELAEIVQRTTRGKEAEARKVMEGAELLDWQQTAAEVVIAPHVLDFAARLVIASHPNGQGAPDAVKQNVRFGASPRAAQALVRSAKVAALLDGRLNVSFRDLRMAAKPVFRHRLVLAYQAQAEGVGSDQVIDKMLETVPDAGETA
ncbi:MAG: MoxR family ATPase [Planctomycetes bacterium]|nr:MoxR family ATPase [Planctomycetota bacterium]